MLYEDVLGVVDFHPSSDTAVLYISEADLAFGSAYRRRAVRLRKVTFAPIVSFKINISCLKMLLRY